MNRERVANKVSDIFNPLYTAIVFLFVVSLYAAQTILDGIKYWLITCFFFSFLPLMDVRRRMEKGVIADAHISNREDRIVPFLVSLFSAIAGLMVIYALEMPPEIKAVSWSIVLTGAIITAITILWKISLHAAGISAIVTVLIVLFGLFALPALVFVPLVFWARLTLNKHTSSQLLAGSGLAVAITLGVFGAFHLF